VIDESDLQYEKHFDSTISTFRGIKIDSSDEYKNASDSIRVKCESDSNIMNRSFQRPFTITIEFGIQELTISELLPTESVTVLTEPLSTTTRRS
jgi:hypothetical protein